MKPTKEQFDQDTAKYGLVHKAAMDNDVRWAKIGSTPRKPNWKKAK